MSKKYPWKYQSVGDFDPLKGERMAPAWLAMAEMMADGQWHSRDELVEAGLAASDIQRGTVLNILSKLSAPDGPVDRRGAAPRRCYRMRVE